MTAIRLNGVRPRRPEQYGQPVPGGSGVTTVSMESGLEDRNNNCTATHSSRKGGGLNGVRPRRPEQSSVLISSGVSSFGGLNGVRPRRPEQSYEDFGATETNLVSQWSPA